ncbi:hypothetical protein JKP88DRAFT_174279 [Tribonema minus]|uniref:Sulphur transport domain-containing protein n=1 Tax=Tribonema minus TaxID=303371 RepID=A0A835ZGA3_9STRA|nr:hypothetical protein JKP88DRAFT_174279 [Tribonema minus]
MLPATEWTLQQSLAGGIVLGSSTALMMVLKGRIAGLSGIFATITQPLDDSWHWKAAFTAGFAGASAAIAIWYPGAFITEVGYSRVRYALAGALVGFGARLGNGCTSGHGICGLARLSRRSLVAVLTFMTAAAAVATSLELNGALTTLPPGPADQPGAPSGAAAAVLLAAAAAQRCYAKRDITSLFVSVPLGALFAAGLALAGMGNRGKVLGFLVPRIGGGDGGGAWDPSLALVMGGAIPVAALGFAFTKRRTPLLGGAKCPPPPSDIDLPLVLGAWIFGAGWGAAGLCPGPAVLLAAAGVRNVWAYFVPAMAAGMAGAKAVNAALARRRQRGGGGGGAGGSDSKQH